MKYITICTYLLLCLLTYSCKKEDNSNSKTPVVNKSLSFLDNARSDSCGEDDFYIKGEFNGKKLCFASKRMGDAYHVDTFMNCYYFMTDTAIDNLALMRENADQSIGIALYCGQTHITERTFPYALPHPNLEQCEFTTLQFINYNHDYSIGQDPRDDNYTFNGYTGDEFYLTFTRLTKDNIIEGEFSGKLMSNTWSGIHVKNGKFRIQFVTKEMKYR